MKRRSFLTLLPALLVTPAGICAPPNPNFSGTWKQSNERCMPKRSGDVVLRIDHHDPEISVETTAQRASAPPRHALQRYTTDGRTSVSTGADGDQFRTSIVWKGQSLIFSVEEHEDGRVILSSESWTLIENGAALERVRESAQASSDRTGKQILIYLLEALPG